MPSYENADTSFFSEANGGPVTVKVSAAGATIALNYSDRALYVANATTYATLTILLPKKVQDGEMVQIAFESAVTALTLHTGFGAAITGAPTAGAAGAAIIMRFVNAAVGWVHWK
jgi:hypothetical protein